MKSKRKPKVALIEFRFPIEWKDTEVEADVLAEVAAGYPPTWNEYSGGDPGEPSSVEMLNVWVDVSDDYDHPEEISSKLPRKTIAKLEEVAIEKAGQWFDALCDDDENNAFDRANDR